MKKTKKAKKITTKKSAASKTAKSRTPKKTSSESSLRRSTKKMVDDVLLRMNPQVQKQFENLKASIESTPTSVSDLKILGLKVLERARIFSESLKASSGSPGKKPLQPGKLAKNKK